MKEFFLIPTAYAGAITDAPKISAILANGLNFLLSIVIGVAIIAMVVAGLLYLTAHGSEERMKLAKRALVSGLTGGVIALGALVIINVIAAFFD